MNSYINYLVEANFGLLLFFILYKLLLSNETAFGYTRRYLLAGVIASLLFPLFTINAMADTLPSISQVLPLYMLPEVVINGSGANIATSHTIYNAMIWEGIEYVYLIVVLFLAIQFLRQLIKLFTLSRRYPSYQLLSRYNVIELNIKFPTFSFFNCIYIGNAHELNQTEKQQIIDHEIVHIDKRHSLDILLIESIRILFWFNPLMTRYKNILTTIHEYQADEKTTEHHDVNQYCNLLARVALMSADFKLANHFNNSLTIKRINMMKTMKKKMVGWKLAIIISAMGALFFITACQDQVSTATEIAKGSTMAVDVPDEVQKQYDELKKLHPEKHYKIIEATSEESIKKFNELQSSYVSIVETKPNKSEPTRTFMIVEFNDQAKEISERAKSADDVYTVVEEMPVPTEGMENFYRYLMNEIKYPKEAREKGIEGTVFVSVVVQLDGSLSDVNVLKSVSKTLDEEAIRVLQHGPKWNPGQQNGKDVKTKMVMPIKFSLANSNNANKVSGPTGSLKEVSVVGLK